jgi:glycosyltransferase involved in cell wall biosynthesis
VGIVHISSSKLKYAEKDFIAKGGRQNMLRKKKIIIISDRVYPYFKGGAEKRYWEIAKHLTNLGYEICFLTGQWPKMPKNSIIDGVQLKAVYKVGMFYINGRKSIWETIKYTLNLVRFLAFERYDLIECEQFPIFPIFVCKVFSSLKRKPFVVTWHEVWGKELWIPYLGHSGHIGAFVEFTSTHLPDRIISVSPQTTNKLIHLFHISPKKIDTIPNGFDLNWDARCCKDARIVAGAGNNSHLMVDRRVPVKYSDVIYVGRLLSHKNVDILIRAIKILTKYHPDIVCLVIGDGPERNNLEELVSSLGIQRNVYFMGSISNEKRIYSKMKASKVFVLPSIREGFGISVLEANACGLPVIVINHHNNAACGLVRNGSNGYTSDLDDIKIAELIAHVLNAPQNSYTEACCKNAQSYCWEHISKQVDNVYSNFLEKPHRDSVAIIESKG